MVEHYAENQCSQDDPHNHGHAGVSLMPGHPGFKGLKLLLLLMQTRVVRVH